MKVSPPAIVTGIGEQSRHHRSSGVRLLTRYGIEWSSRFPLIRGLGQREMAPMGNDDAFKYDIAFSFVREDDSLATQLNDQAADARENQLLLPW